MMDYTMYTIKIKLIKKKPKHDPNGIKKNMLNSTYYFPCN